MHRFALLFALLFVPAPLFGADAAPIVLSAQPAASAKAAEFDPKPIDEVVEKALKEFRALWGGSS